MLGHRPSSTTYMLDPCTAATGDRVPPHRTPPCSRIAGDELQDVVFVQVGDVFFDTRPVGCRAHHHAYGVSHARGVSFTCNRTGRWRTGEKAACNPTHF